MESEPRKLYFRDLKIVIENPKGTYKSFESEDGSESNAYPLKGVTYPVDYGHIEGFVGEDGDGLDVFTGSGSIHGFIKVWRLDVPEETKLFLHLTKEELQLVTSAYAPVLNEVKELSEHDVLELMNSFRANAP